MKPFAESSVQNREPIFEVISPYLQRAKTLLEIGSGTGQHAVYFSADFPHLTWQTTELLEQHAGIHAWLDDYALGNVLAPITLDVMNESHWLGINQYDMIYSANTLHIMSAEHVKLLFSHLSEHLHDDGVFTVYGPFNYDGKYTSQSNEEFDFWLKRRDPVSGIRDFEWVNQLANENGLELLDDVAMPANNRTLIWQKKC